MDKKQLATFLYKWDITFYIYIRIARMHFVMPSLDTVGISGLQTSCRRYYFCKMTLKSLRYCPRMTVQFPMAAKRLSTPPGNDLLEMKMS
jgi:hypothetical protein